MSEKMEKYEESRPENVEDRPWVTPRVDIFENDQELLLKADVPGVREGSLDIRLDQEELTFSGRREELDAGTPLGREFRMVDYRRTFLVPTGIDHGKVTAELKNGVLWLHLPKSEAVKPRQITVKAG